MAFFVHVWNNRRAHHLDSPARRAQEHPAGNASPSSGVLRLVAPIRYGPFHTRRLPTAAGPRGYCEIDQNVRFNGLIWQSMAATTTYPHQWALGEHMIRSGSYSVWFKTLRG